MPWRASLDSWLVHTGKIRFLVFVCRQGVFQDADGVCERHGWQIQISGFDVLVPAGGAVPCGRNRLALLLDRHHGQTRSALLSCSLHFFFFFFFFFFLFLVFYFCSSSTSTCPCSSSVSSSSSSSVSLLCVACHAECCPM